MKRFWTAMAVALCTIFAVSGCNDYGNTFQSPGGAFVSFLSPSQIPACVSGNSGTCSDLTLTLNGSGFVAKTKVQWNGKNLVTTVPTDSSGNPLGNIVTAVVPAALLAKPGTATVNTINPNSNYGTGTNGLSNTITFIINNLANPIPTVTSVSPSCATAGSNLALTVTGANFLNSSTDPTQVSTVNWTLGALQMQLTAPTATITSTQITATIPAANISGAGNASVTVYNPPSPPVPNVPGSTGSEDPAIGIGQNNIGKPAGQVPNTIYLGWISADNHAHSKIDRVPFDGEFLEFLPDLPHTTILTSFLGTTITLRQRRRH